jgi:hypothetical protein
MFSGNITRCFNIRTLRVDRNHSASRSLQNVVRGGGQADELCLEFPGAWEVGCISPRNNKAIIS